MRKKKKKRESGSIWTRELIPEDSVWRKELIPEDSIWRKDLIAFAGRKKSPCLQCPVLMVAEEHRCNHFAKIPDDIWNGLQTCPLHEKHRSG